MFDLKQALRHLWPLRSVISCLWHPDPIAWYIKVTIDLTLMLHLAQFKLPLIQDIELSLMSRLGRLPANLLISFMVLRGQILNSMTLGLFPDLGKNILRSKNSYVNHHFAEQPV